jgi:hypothetical protein
MHNDIRLAVVMIMISTMYCNIYFINILSAYKDFSVTLNVTEFMHCIMKINSNKDICS